MTTEEIRGDFENEQDRVRLVNRLMAMEAEQDRMPVDLDEDLGPTEFIIGERMRMGPNAYWQFQCQVKFKGLLGS